MTIEVGDTYVRIMCGAVVRLTVVELGDGRSVPCSAVYLTNGQPLPGIYYIAIGAFGRSVLEDTRDNRVALKKKAKYRPGEG